MVSRPDAQMSNKQQETSTNTSNICKNTRALGNYKLFMLTLDFHVIFAELFDLLVKEMGNDGEVLPTYDKLL